MKRSAELSPGSEAPSFKKTDQTKNKTLEAEANRLKSKNKTANKTTNDSTKFNTPASTSTPRERPYRFERPIVYGEGNERMHTSTNSVEEVPPEITRHNSIVSPLIDKVIFEIFKKDYAIFDGPLPRDAFKVIWTDHFERSIDEVRSIWCERVQGKSLKIFYKLKVESTILEITKTHETELEIKLGSKIHVFNARFPQFKDISCELGKLVTLSIYKIPHEIDIEDIREWLNLFGEIQGNFRYHTL
jgi:hypothetical protein